MEYDVEGAELRLPIYAGRWKKRWFVWIGERLEDPPPSPMATLLVRQVRSVYERSGRLLNVLRAAARLDPDLAGAWHDLTAQRVDRSRRTAENLRAKAAVRLRLPQDDTALTLLALTEPELFSTYTAGNRTASQYEAWLADILCRSLLR